MVPTNRCPDLRHVGAPSLDRREKQLAAHRPTVGASLSTGATDTPIIDGQFKTPEAIAGAKQMFAQRTPLGRIGEPQDIASAVVSLTSDEARWITGETLCASGGAHGVGY